MRRCVDVNSDREKEKKRESDFPVLANVAERRVFMVFCVLFFTRNVLSVKNVALDSDIGCYRYRGCRCMGACLKIIGIQSNITK